MSQNINTSTSNNVLNKYVGFDIDIDNRSGKLKEILIKKETLTKETLTNENFFGCKC